MNCPPEEGLPLPPPFMFACGDCAELLAALVRKVTADAGCFSEQLAVAVHVADAHLEDVPPPHADCAICTGYQERADAHADVQRHWAEHRARDLFLPKDVARLL
ncbi:hypothetical protein HG826_08960 [Streptomyces sp. GMY01]|uniref:hypothetical protein n=1 Tax=Streptomyces sp. GMY02 TaxID=1333528 RepID=UPI00146BCE9D|nr:hypothetical protein [Streptomyces sp. GMY02]NMO33711.1 hypothetical protein [Streptomyces sp. GMY02]